MSAIEFIELNESMNRINLILYINMYLYIYINTSNYV